MSSFNPNNIALDNGNLYGLPLDLNTAACVVFPVPWDVTVSYKDGTANAPKIIQQESLQVDLYDLTYQNFWDKGIYFEQPSEIILNRSTIYRNKAIQVLDKMSNGSTIDNDSSLRNEVQEINQACKELMEFVYTETKKFIDQDKKVILLGGDHSTPLGYIKALSEKYQDFGILQIDAHCDLREAYEDFEFSHASVMFNALKLKSVQSLHQVGIRDFCQEELDVASDSEKKVQIYFDRDIKYQMYAGTSWHQICENIVNNLPQFIYLSFDIDGLNPALCPNTGTPVAGGFEVDQIFYLLDMIKKSGKQFIGMDLNEVGNDVWDANVGARVLYRMIGLWLS
jgi:agmatinase